MKAVHALTICTLLMLAGCASPAEPGPAGASATDPDPTTPGGGGGVGTGGGGGGAGHGGSGGTGAGNGTGAGPGGLNSTAPLNGTGNATPPARNWASLSSATIRPGVQMDGCTTNFLFTSPTNGTVYVGTAAHCFGNGLPNETNGCDQSEAPDPLGTQVGIDGAGDGGTLVYSSWLAMMAAGETDDEACAENDFALMELSDRDAAKANPAMLQFGGPTGVFEGSLGVGDKVLTYGNSGTRQDIDALSPHEGYVVGSSGWSTLVYTVSPGIPGDSGSGVMTSDGEALGILVTVNSYPPASNGVTSLSKALEYACKTGGFCVEMATWELIDGGVLP